MSKTLLDRLRRFYGFSLIEKAESLSNVYWLFKTQWYYWRFFGRIGRGTKIISPMRLKNVQHITIGDDVIVNRHVFLLTHTIRGTAPPRLVIGDGCVIGHINHITAAREVVIGKKVLTADRVHISDNSHSFDNPSVPILAQVVTSKGSVSIGDGTWIGENVSVLSCSIGRNCVIGANAVVLNDIPDYCVAVGAPARIVRRLNPLSGVWEKTGVGH